MNCYIDAGNSRIKGRLARRTQASAEPFSVTWPEPAEPDAVGALATRLEPLLVDEKGRSPRQIVLASVVEPRRREWLETALAEICPTAKRRWLSVPRKCCHVRVAYEDPARLGIDRFCAMIEAHALVEGRPLAVINAGTAVTLDVLEADGQHRGGLILPGWRAQLEGLRSAAPGLGEAVEPLLSADDAPASELNADDSPGVAEATRQLGLAVDTTTAIDVGRHWLLAAGVNEMLAVWRQALADQGELLVVLAGGDAERLAALVSPEVDVRVESDLVLAGMVRLAKARR
ncbi:type III pantothenate kinase [Guyparkeria hydrothermalis]|uniref:type III pantothenate kinase n=1 Tax=Guyparkeria hydrothermalis TaxID=923 RepID=UPI00201FE92F|nr:type III pantothenate kinase [Guyparkeria hydrothermalis]